MRADFGLYVVAVICFIIAALPYTNELLILDHPMNLTLTVIFAASGLIFAILGYALRPKPIISIPEARKPALSPSPPPAPSPREEVITVPSPAPTPPTPPQEETAKPERKKPKAKTKRKRTRRRRKKA